MLRFTLPVVLFLILVIVLALGLSKDPSLVPSPLVGKPAPEFSLPRLRTPDQNLSLAELRGSVSLLNVWATWCAGCRQEHDMLLEIAATGIVSIYGLNWKDNRKDALRWLRVLGDPYIANAVDDQGEVCIDYGVYGAPETFVLAPDGRVAYKHVGPITREIWEQTLRPLIAGLQADG